MIDKQDEVVIIALSFFGMLSGGILALSAQTPIMALIYIIGFGIMFGVLAIVFCINEHNKEAKGV